MADQMPAGLDEFLQGSHLAAKNDSGLPSSDAPEGLDDFLAPELKEEKYGTLPEQLKTGLESAASAATFGLSKGVEKALGVKPEDIEAREQTNPLSSFAGSTAGLIGSAALGGLGAANLLEHAGVSAAGALGLGAEGAGIGSRIGAGAVKGFVEGGLFQGGNEVAKMMLDDPAQSVGTAAANMGLAGLLGGGIGGSLGGTGALWDAAVGKKVASALDNASAELSGDTSQITHTPEISNEFLNTQKPNVNELQESLSRLGVEGTPGTLSNEKLVQNLEGNLSRRPTIAGVKIQKEQDLVFKALEKSSKEILRDATVKTEAQVGREIKEGLAKKFSDELKPIESQYKALEPHMKSIEVSDNLKLDAIDKIANHEFAKIDPELETLAKKISGQVEKIENANDLKNVRSLIGEQLSEAYRSGSPKARILQTAKDALTNMREAAVEQASVKSGAKEAGSLAEQTISDIRSADSQYRNFKEKLKGFGTEAGVGNPSNARALLQKFSKISDENFATRIFDTNDINQMKFFKEHFPEQFDLARRYKLKEIAEKSISEAQGKNGQFEVGKFLRQVSDQKLNPEARSMLFDGIHAQKLSDIQNVYRAIPGNPNPSGTSYASAFGDLFSPKGLIQNATDAVQYAFLKSMPHLKEAMRHVGSDEASQLAALNFARNADKGVSPTGFKAMAELISNTIKGENLLAKGSKNVFKEGADVLPSHLIPDDRKRDRLDKRLANLEKNPNELFNVGSEVGHYMPEHAQAMAQVAASGVNYLNSLRPKTGKASPLDTERAVNPIEKAEFQNALSIADQPLIILNKIKTGMVSAKDIKHLQSIYPGLYERLSQKLSNQLILQVHKNEHITYATRMGLSKFLAQPLDSTMLPASIMAAQPKPEQAKPQMAQSNPQGPHSMKNLSKISVAALTPSQARAQQKSSLK